jgi:hypothetical protein
MIDILLFLPVLLILLALAYLFGGLMEAFAWRKRSRGGVLERKVVRVMGAEYYVVPAHEYVRCFDWDRLKKTTREEVLFRNGKLAGFSEWPSSTEDTNTNPTITGIK